MTLAQEAKMEREARAARSAAILRAPYKPVEKKGTYVSMRTLRRRDEEKLLSR